MNWRLFLSSGFGFGLSPVAPGTLGALIGLAWHFLGLYLRLGPWTIRGWCLLAVIACSIAHYRLTPWAQAYWKDSDPGHFVLDEIVGYLVVPVFCVPLPNVKWIFAAFAIERIIDIIKFPGARYFDRKVHTATGVIMDDVVAGVYTAIIMSCVVILKVV